MTIKPWTTVVPLAAFLCVSLLPRAAAAQASSGPMTVQRIGNSVFVAPDFKVTDFNGKACGLVGAYGGYLIENTFFIGLGGYGLTDTSNQRDMWYFGLVTGVYINRDRPIGFGLKALIGGGEATIGQQYAYVQPPRHGAPGVPVVVNDYYHSNMFVFEPEANVVVHLGGHMKLTGGVGYRLTGDPYYGYYGYYGYSDSRLNGVTGSVSLQIGAGL